jgi:hypothetical protein
MILHLALPQHEERQRTFESASIPILGAECGREIRCVQARAVRHEGAMSRRIPTKSGAEPERDSGKGGNPDRHQAQHNRDTGVLAASLVPRTLATGSSNRPYGRHRARLEISVARHRLLLPKRLLADRL